MQTRTINLPKFFLVYSLILIPTMLISFISGQIALDRQKEQEHARFHQQLTLLMDQLDAQYIDYIQSGIVLAGQADMRPDKMVDNDTTAYNGIALLQSSFIGADVCDVFVYYGRGSIYSRLGLTNPDVYFRDVLFLSEPDRKAATEILMSDSKSLTPIYMTDGRTQLLIHIPVDMGKTAPHSSMNVLLSTSALTNMMEQLCTMEGSYICFRFSSGAPLCFAGDDRDSIRRISADQLPADSKQYLTITHTSIVTDMDVAVYYQANQVYRNVNRWQQRNFFLYSIGSLLSLLIAFAMSRRQERQIAGIEKLLSGGDVQSMETPRFGFFNRLFDRAAAVVRENSEFQRGMRVYQQKIKQQTAQLIFRGAVKDSDVIQQLLDFCELSLCEKYFFIGCLAVQNEAQLDRLEECMSGDLHIEISGERRMIVFLAELPCSDPTRNLRERLAYKLAEVLDSLGSGKVQIAMSSVYDDICFANQAYMEATWVIERMGGFTAPVQFDYWENIARHEAVTIQLDSTDIQALTAALQKKRMIAANDAFGRMEYAISARCSSVENQRYLRYCILQTVIAQLSTDAAANAEFLQEAVRLDPTDIDQFSNGIRNLITCYCATRSKESHLEKAVAYIDQNYQRYDLSLEEIADYVGLSKNYLSNLFRVHIGAKYMDYLTTLRMSKVQSLLIDTDLPINEVFRLVGYVDKANYSKRFKAIFGVSAQELRRAAREGRLSELPYLFPTDASGHVAPIYTDDDAGDE